MTTTKATSQTASAISFTAKLYTINDWVILQLPKSASEKLPSRGQVMITGTLNGQPFETPLEPDGKGSHWVHIEPKMLKSFGLASGDTVNMRITPIKTWPEPEIPADLRQAIENDPEAYAVWKQATPLAHWEWIRWSRATNNAETRKHRLEVACSKMRAGERRPCCWNRNLCSEPSVSKSGALLEPNSKNS